MKLYGNVVNDLTGVNSKQEEQNERIIRLLEQQLAQSNRQIEALTEQVRQLTKALYGSKSEKSKYQAPDGQGSLFEDDPSFSDSEQTEEQSTETISYTVVRKVSKKKRNDSFSNDIEIEEIHHHPANTQCDCCLHQMTEVGATVIREEAKFIPATMKRVQHIEHAMSARHAKKTPLKKHKSSEGKRHKLPFNVVLQDQLFWQSLSTISLFSTCLFTAR